MDEVDCKISDAEWIVMKVLWQQSPLTSTEIIDYLKDKSDWKPKTVHSLINRLVKKGVLGINKDSSQFMFYPLVKKEECEMEETRSFIKKVYDGSLSLMVSNFIKNEKPSKEEIKELQNLLNKIDK